MRVNDKQKNIMKLLWDFDSLRESQIMKLCNCSETDINNLISNKVISKDVKKGILKYAKKEINNRNIVAFDVVMNYLGRNPILKKGKLPVNVHMQTDYYTYDIIAIKEVEIEALFDKIDEISKAERVIIIIETKDYRKQFLNTKRSCYICTYSPLEIVDRINWKMYSKISEKCILKVLKNV